MEAFVNSEPELATAELSWMASRLPRRIRHRLARRIIDAEKHLLRAETSSPVPTPKGYSTWKSQLATVSLTLAALAMALAFVWAVNFYAGGIDVANQPNVINLRAEGFISKIAFGRSPACGTKECWLIDRGTSSEWTSVALPEYDFRAHPQYRRAIDDGLVYYFFDLPVPPKLANGVGEIAFSPQFIHHNQYTAYVDGEPVFNGSSANHLDTAAVIPLPKHLIKNGHVPLVIKASVAPTDLGIYHHGAMVVGPASTLSQFSLSNERQMSTYFLLFLLTKGSVFLVFSLVYLFTKKTRTLGSFLVYAFATTLDPLIAADFFSTWISVNAQIAVVFTLRAIASFALLHFFADRFELRVNRGWIWLAGSVVSFCVAAAATDYGWGAHHLQFSWLLLATNSLHWLTAVFGLSMGTLRLVSLRLHRRAVPLNLPSFLLFLACYLGLITWEFYFVSYTGFIRLALFDLLFFYIIVWELSREFGSDELRLEQKTEELANARVDQVIAQTTRMLAHDIRSPFASLRMVLEVLTGEDDIDQLRELKAKILPALQQRLAVVDDMVADILSASAAAEVTPGPISLIDLIKSTMTDALFTHQSFNLSVSYDFQHRRLLNVDETKMRRVLTNIVSNAIEAMKDHGKIWFHSEEVAVGGDSPELVLTIGNSDSYIPPESLGRVFEVFYTKGKAKGTGLGLAIAKKIVALHGGKIWCTSSWKDGTEFHMTLPVDRQMETATADTLPKDSQGFALLRRQQVGALREPNLIDRKEQDLKDRVDALLKNIDRPVRVLIVDDETLYLKGMEMRMRSTPVLSERLTIAQAQDAWQAIDEIGQAEPDLIVCDVRLGNESMNGFDLVQRLRNSGVTADICLHSSFHTSADYRRAMQSGADSFLPKPLSSAHFYGLLIDVLAKRQGGAKPVATTT